MADPELVFKPTGMVIVGPNWTRVDTAIVDGDDSFDDFTRERPSILGVPSGPEQFLVVGLPTQANAAAALALWRIKHGIPGPP